MLDWILEPFTTPTLEMTAWLEIRGLITIIVLFFIVVGIIALVLTIIEKIKNIKNN